MEEQGRRLNPAWDWGFRDLFWFSHSPQGSWASHLTSLGLAWLRGFTLHPPNELLYSEIPCVPDSHQTALLKASPRGSPESVKEVWPLIKVLINAGGGNPGLIGKVRAPIPDSRLTGEDWLATGTSAGACVSLCSSQAALRLGVYLLGTRRSCHRSPREIPVSLLALNQGTRARSIG